MCDEEFFRLRDQSMSSLESQSLSQACELSLPLSDLATFFSPCSEFLDKPLEGF